MKKRNKKDLKQYFQMNVLEEMKDESKRVEIISLFDNKRIKVGGVREFFSVAKFQCSHIF